MCPVKSIWIIVEPLQQCWTVCFSVLWENNLSCMGCSTNDVPNGRSTANVEYPEFCSGWIGLVKLMQRIEFEQVKWMQISCTVVLKIVVGVKLVPVVLSKQNFFCGPVEGLEQIIQTVLSLSSRLTFHFNIIARRFWIVSLGKLLPASLNYFTTLDLYCVCKACFHLANNYFV